MRTSVRATRRRVAATLIAVAGVLHLLPQPDTPLHNGEVRILRLANPNLEVPHGSTVRTVDGHPLKVLNRRDIPGGELLATGHLEPGTYAISWPGSGYGGRHLPARASIVIIEAVDGEANHGPFANRGAALAGILIAGLLMVAFFTGRARPGSRRMLGGGTLAVLLVLWGGSGWSNPGMAAIAAMLLVVLAGTLVMVDEPSTSSGALLSAGVGVLLWPTDLVGGMAGVVAVVCAFTSVARSCHQRQGALAGIGAALLVAAGVWSGHAGAVGNDVFRLGTAQDGGLDFAECVALDGVNKTLGKECFRAVGVRLGATLPANEAMSALLAGLESVGVREDSQCRTAGLSLGYSAARWGPDRHDLRKLFTELGGVCYYSSMHGVVSGAFAYTPEADFAANVVTLCGATSPDRTTISDVTYSRQCWQGAGIALGRRTRYEDPAILALCEKGVPDGKNNCTDGYFQEFVDQKERASADPSSRLYPEETSILSLCRNLPGSLAGGCYRYVAEEAYYDGGTRSEGLLELQRICREGLPEGHGVPCWYALGMVSVRVLLQGSFAELAAPVEEACGAAPSEETYLQCLHGGGNAIVGLLGADTPVERICAWFPAKSREEYCGYTERYYDYLKTGNPRG